MSDMNMKVCRFQKTTIKELRGTLPAGHPILDKIKKLAPGAVVAVDPVKMAEAKVKGTPTTK